MSIGHPSEEELQQYALAGTGDDEKLASHVTTCETCLAVVHEYRQLFLAVEQVPRPVFNFNAVELVLAQLPSPAAVNVRKKSLNYSLVIACIGVSLCALLAFRKFFINVAGSISHFLLFIITAAALIIIFYQAILLYRNYQKQINALNLD